MNKKSSPTILIVDDDTDLCTILSINLKHIASLHTESTLADAMNYLRHEEPTLILLDNNLPDGCGVHFIEKIRHLYHSVKIVLITADTAKDLRQESLLAGATFFLCKPFTIQTITETVQRVLNAA